MGVRLFVGAANCTSVKGEPFDLTGSLEYSATNHGYRVYRPQEVEAFLDSGAFTDVRRTRLTPEAALVRQLAWERRAGKESGVPDWQVKYMVSYDQLIDEKMVGGRQVKRRWSLAEGEAACAATIEAARYLASHRTALAPRTLVLSCQGVDHGQYAACAAEVLRWAKPGDWFGLGGWCILGRNRRWLPEFWATLYRVLPMVQGAGLSHVHLFGVMWLPALGGFLWLADRHGLTVSTDSAKPVLDCTRPDPRRAGVRDMAGYRQNVAWWRRTLAELRHSEHYRRPPFALPPRQMELALCERS